MANCFWRPLHRRRRSSRRADRSEKHRDLRRHWMSGTYTCQSKSRTLTRTFIAWPATGSARSSSRPHRTPGASSRSSCLRRSRASTATALRTRPKRVEDELAPFSDALRRGRPRRVSRTPWCGRRGIRSCFLCSSRSRCSWWLSRKVDKHTTNADTAPIAVDSFGVAAIRAWCGQRISRYARLLRRRPGRGLAAHPPLRGSSRPCAVPVRALLPRPVRTEGDKARIGEPVRCAYWPGELIKRITDVELARLLEFEVVSQNLGIERCILVQRGSYKFSLCGNGTDVALVTNYLTYLCPRRRWRPAETLLVRQLHRHIIDGVRGALFRANALTHPAVSPSGWPPRGSRGDVAWTSHSSSRR